MLKEELKNMHQKLIRKNMWNRPVGDMDMHANTAVMLMENKADNGKWSHFFFLLSPLSNFADCIISFLDS